MMDQKKLKVAVDEAKEMALKEYAVQRENLAGQIKELHSIASDGKK